MATQTQLGVMAKDDNMDMALSPYQQPVDDLDIDFDHMDDQYQPPHDDAMEDYQPGEDHIDDTMGDQELVGLNDDDMLEDEHQEHDHNGEEVDVGVSAAIDQETAQELVDDEDILYDDEPEEQPNDPSTDNPGHATDTYDFGLDQEHPNDPDSKEQQHLLSETNNTTDPSQQEPNILEQPATESSSRPQDTNNTEEHSDEHLSTDAAQFQGETDAPEASNQSTKPTNETAQTLDLAAIEDSAVEEALRSIRVFWDNAEWTLFSTRQDATDCFFQDTAYAYEPMDKFLEACRNVIPGDELGQHDELTFIIDELGLSVCEDSKYAPSLTLAHIIELYLTLHRNGSQETVAIIPCALQSRTCLHTYYKTLLQNAMDGKNLAEVVADTVESSDEAIDLGHEHVTEADDHDDLHDDQAENGASNNHDEGEAEQVPDYPAAEGVVVETAPAEENVESNTNKAEDQETTKGEDGHVGENDLLGVLDEDEGNEPTDTNNAHEEAHEQGEDLVDDSSLALNTDTVAPENGQDTGATPSAQDLFGQSSQIAATPVAATPALYEDPGAPPPISDFDSYNDGEEMLRLRQEEFAEQQPELEPQISFGATNGAEEAEEVINDLENDENNPEETLDPETFIDEVGVEDEPEEELDLVSLAPETPQKGSANKRKAFEEEDDFDLSAFDTPDAKRRRPS